jgi:hypothetical protein
MKAFPFILLFAHICVCHGDDEEDTDPPYEPSTRNDFIHFKNSLPENILSIPLGQEELLLHFIELYNEEKNKIFPYEIFHERENRAQLYGSLTANINVAVVFLGFPATSLPRMRELWFNQLMRTDHLEGVASSSREDVLHAPGRVHLKHHFHVMETSLHLESTLISSLEAIAQLKSPDSDEYYLNAWEVDALLTSLKEAIFQSDQPQPAMTFYILNLDLLAAQTSNSSSTSPSPRSYSYSNGYSRHDMNQIKQSEAVRQAAGQVVRLFPHKSRVIVDEATTEFPLNSGEPVTASSGSSGDREGIKFETDKIRSSKAWAASVKENLEKVSRCSLPNF